MIVVRIQLTGDVKGYLDVSEGKAVPVVYAASDVSDLSKKTGNTSRNIQLANTANNHVLLNHYFDANAEAGTFDVNKKTKCLLLQDDVSIMDNATLQLVAVRKYKLNSNDECIVEYDAIIKDSTADFFTMLGSKELTDLDFSDLNHKYTVANVVASFGNTVADGYKYPLCWSSGNAYNLEDFRPAIYDKIYLDRIFASNGFSYEWQGIDDDGTRFSKMVTMYNGDEVTVSDKIADSVSVVANSSSVQEVTDAYTPVTTPTAEKVIVDTQVRDDQGYYDASISKYTNEFAISTPKTLDYQIDIRYRVVLRNNELLDVKVVAGVGSEYTISPELYLVNQVPTTADYRTLVPGNVDSRVYVDANGYVVVDSTYAGIGHFSSGDTVLATGDNSFTLSATALAIGQVMQLDATQFVQPFATFERVLDSAPADVVPVLEIDYISIRIVPSSNAYGVNMPVVMNAFVPKKVKQSDFVKGIFTLNNLYVEIDQFNASKLVLKKRDKYYDDGVEDNWTDLLDEKKEQMITFVPAVQSKKLRLTYKADEDDANKTYFNATSEVYGQVEYEFKNDFVKDVDVIEVLFSATPVGKTSFGAVVPLLNGRAPKCNIRMLYDGGVFDCGAYTILDTPGGTTTTVTTYPSISHFDKPENPTFDMNFSTCDYYFYTDLGAKTNNTFFNNNWRRTVDQMDNGKLWNAHFFLNEAKVNRMRMSDKIFVLNSWWQINKINYDANTSDSTQCELLYVDRNQKFSAFKTGAAAAVGVADTLFSAIKALSRKIFQTSNVSQSQVDIDIIGINNYIGSSVVAGAVYGSGNKVTASRVIVIGDNVVADVDGVYTDRVVFPGGVTIDASTGAGANFANTNLTLSGDRIQNLDVYELLFTGGQFGINSPLILPSLPVYLNNIDAAAVLGTGVVYQTPTGEVRIVY